MDIGVSKNGVPIRLTDERWQHITSGHPEIADYYYEILETIETPEIIYEGSNNAKIAFKKITAMTNKFMAVVYKEIDETDGFVITAYLSDKEQEFQKKKILWKPLS